MVEATFKPVYRIMDLHESDRPRERLATLAVQCRTDCHPATGWRDRRERGTDGAAITQ
jgi:hypothetical protein